MQEPCFLVLDDGTIFPGISFGADAPTAYELKDNKMESKAIGELVFNTGMSGYHEILTDPSYTGQIVLMTYPHIGNYGTDDNWSEIGPEKEGRSGIKPAGMVVRSLYKGPIPEGRKTLHTFLRENDTPGITNVDTRALTLRTRDLGSSNCAVIKAVDADKGLSDEEKAACLDYLKGFPKMEGRSLIGNVGTEEKRVINEEGSIHVAMLDCGVKMNIVRELVKQDCKVTMFPETATAEEILASGCQGVMFSSGPGDPAVLKQQIETAKGLIDKIPFFGICLGHQIISQALGAKTYKMKFGHHGINNPVRDEETKKVFVTSQNHGFAVEEKSLPKGMNVWFRNANDGSIEGLADRSRKILIAQFHPEAAPGPHDSAWIFKSFVDLIPR